MYTLRFLTQELLNKFKPGIYILQPLQPLPRQILNSVFWRSCGVEEEIHSIPTTDCPSVCLNLLRNSRLLSSLTSSVSRYGEYNQLRWRQGALRAAYYLIWKRIHGLFIPLNLGVRTWKSYKDPRWFTKSFLGSLKRLKQTFSNFQSTQTYFKQSVISSQTRSFSQLERPCVNDMNY